MIIHNSDESQTYTVGINNFADFTHEEFMEYYNLKAVQDPCVRDGNAQYFKSTGASAPDYLNYVKTGKVSPVKDQASCGSCWAFATVGAIESNYLINHNTVLDLSEQ